MLLHFLNLPDSPIQNASRQMCDQLHAASYGRLYFFLGSLTRAELSDFPRTKQKQFIPASRVTCCSDSALCCFRWLGSFRVTRLPGSFHHPGWIQFEFDIFAVAEPSPDDGGASAPGRAAVPLLQQRFYTSMLCYVFVSRWLLLTPGTHTFLIFA